MIDAPLYNPKAIKEAQFRSPVSAIAQWLDAIDVYGKHISLQYLTDKPFPHPLERQGSNTDDHLVNLQLAVITLDLLNNPSYFAPGKAQELLAGFQAITLVANQPIWKGTIEPSDAMRKLIEKQKNYLSKGESWQFAKVGLEVSPQAQRIAYKLHALQELLEPFAGPGATQYEDQLADIFTREIMSRADQFKILANAIGPYRFSVRWQDFLEGGENPQLHIWIRDVLQNEFLTSRQEYTDLLLRIVYAKSRVTPAATIQLLEKLTFRSTGKVPPLRPVDVADPHTHTRKVELYLPLMGPGSLKVQYGGEGPVHTFTPNPNFKTNLDLNAIGAHMVDGEVTLEYKGNSYRPKHRDDRVISVLLEDGNSAQFVIVRPGDVHDFTNVGISPASVYAVTLGFPEKPGESLEGDFIEIEDKTRLLS